MISHAGMGCVATLDVDAGTLTLVHSGALARMNDMPDTPRVISLGAIESVEFTKSTMMKRGFVRFLLRSQSGYHRDPNRDVNSYLLKSLKDNTAQPFIQAVQSAIVSVPPVHDYGAPGSAEEIRRPGIVETMRDGYQEFRALEADRAAARAFGKFRLLGESLHYESQSWPVAGASVTIESAGIARSRLTATRVVGGALLFGGTGALIGAAGRKDQSTVFLTVELSDGSVLVDEVPVRSEGDARKFAAVINTAAGQQARTLDSSATRSEPNPPTQAPPIAQGPPAGWYPDPQGSGGNRWWDGAAWTEHRQPGA